MTRYSRLSVLLIIAVSMVLSACSTRIGDFTMMSTKNVEIGAKYVKTGTFEADDKALIIIVIPTGFPNMKTCVDRLLETGGGEVATNVVLNSSYWWAILIGQSGYDIKGDVWKRASIGDLRSGKEIFELHVQPDGRQMLTNVKNPSESYAVSTEADLKLQYDQLVGQQ